MANKANVLLSFWQNESKNFSTGNYIAKPDYQILKDNNLLTKKLSVYNSKNTLLYEDLPCEPFMGDIENAKIYIVTLNPGAGEDEHENWQKQDLLDVWKNNFKQTNQYPFYYLDPKLEKTGGGRYWFKREQNDKKVWGKFENLIEKIACDLKGQVPEEIDCFAEARKLIAQNVCDLELCPYHSEKWNDSKNIISNLPSIKIMIEFLKDNVIPDVISGKKSLLVLRHVTEINNVLNGVEFNYNGRKIEFKDLETLFSDRVVFYKTSGKAARASLKLTEEAGPVIYNQLQDKIKELVKNLNS
ncbi:MAG: hypothetical protein IKZ49_02400 [Alphaproteobacteria bacterium]|nr:hypothetical protein [Alphaproteobacteria bacterium]